jgi:putative ABC transport system permease protein
MMLSNDSAVVNEQLAKKDTDILTGLPFSTNTVSKDEITAEMILGMLSQSPDEMSQNMAVWIKEGMELGVLTERTVVSMFESMIQTEATYETNLARLGYIDLDAPQAINIYTASFEDKDALIELIEAHNDKVTEEGKEELAIEYTDLVGLLMSSISTIINIISYVLIGFVSISLVVSSIMIGIITYISVLERTKEIGILRAMGASKKDISRVFKAETGIVGLLSGLVGIGVTVLLTIPINVIVHALTRDSSTVVSNIASLPVGGAVILVIISVCLTLIGGLIPSKLAAKKDPVEALRSE